MLCNYVFVQVTGVSVDNHTMLEITLARHCITNCNLQNLEDMNHRCFEEFPMSTLLLTHRITRMKVSIKIHTAMCNMTMRHVFWHLEMCWPGDGLLWRIDTNWIIILPLNKPKGFFLSTFVVWSCIAWAWWRQNVVDFNWWATREIPHMTRLLLR